MVWKSILLTGTIVSLGVLTIFGSRLLNLQTQCLSSPLIRQVQWLDSNQTDDRVIADPCSVWQVLKGVRTLSIEQRQQVQTIHELNALSYLIGRPHKTYALAIDSRQPFVYRMGSAQMILGSEWARRPDELKQYLVEAWLQDRALSQSEVRILARFLTHPQTDSQRWIHFLQSKKSYCLDPDRHAAHYQDCESGSEISALGFERFLAQVLAVSLRRMSPRDRLKASRRVFSQGLQLTGWPVQFIKTADVQERLKETVRAYVGSLGLGMKADQDHLQAQLFAAFGLNVTFHLLVDTSDANLALDQQNSLTRTSQRYPFQSIGIVQNKRLRILPEQIQLETEIPYTEHYLLLTCNIPTLGDMSHIQANRVTVLKICGQKEFDWDQILMSQVSNELPPKNIGFYRFHIPSLQLALKKGRPELLQIPIDASAGLAINWSWRGIIGQQTQNVISPVAAINALTDYRN